MPARQPLIIPDKGNYLEFPVSRVGKQRVPGRLTVIMIISRNYQRVCGRNARCGGTGVSTLKLPDVGKLLDLSEWQLRWSRGCNRNGTHGFQGIYNLSQCMLRGNMGCNAINPAPCLAAPGSGPHTRPARTRPFFIATKKSLFSGRKVGSQCINRRRVARQPPAALLRRVRLQILTTILTTSLPLKTLSSL